MDDFLKALTPWDPNGSLSQADADRIWNSYKAAGGGRDVSASLPIGGGLPSGDGGRFTGIRNMDTNPFAINPNNQQQQASTPDYLRPQPNNPTWAGGVSNMVKALMDGNNKFNARQAMSAAAPNPSTTTGGPSVGAPLSLAPPQVAASGVSGPAAGPQMPGVPGSPMFGPRAPDPTVSALFSPVPGEFGGGSMFGG